MAICEELIVAICEELIVAICVEVNCGDFCRVNCGDLKKVSDYLDAAPKQSFKALEHVDDASFSQAPPLVMGLTVNTG